MRRLQASVATQIVQRNLTRMYAEDKYLDSPSSVEDVKLYVEDFVRLREQSKEILGAPKPAALQQEQEITPSYHSSRPKNPATLNMIPPEPWTKSNGTVNPSWDILPEKTRKHASSLSHHNALTQCMRQLKMSSDKEKEEPHKNGLFRL